MADGIYVRTRRRFANVKDDFARTYLRMQVKRFFELLAVCERPRNARNMRCRVIFITSESRPLLINGQFICRMTSRGFQSRIDAGSRSPEYLSFVRQLMLRTWFDINISRPNFEKRLTAHTG